MHVDRKSLHIVSAIICIKVNCDVNSIICIKVDINFRMLGLEGKMTDSKCYYGVATIRRLLKIIGLFGKRDLLKRLYSAKETYIFKEPTNRSHPMI